MSKFTIDLTGDKALQIKINDIGRALNGWVFNRVFKTAARTFVEGIANEVAKAKYHRTHRLGKISKQTLRIRKFRRSRVMTGVSALSMFGTTDPKNDPYYGAFVNYGHKMGRRPKVPKQGSPEPDTRRLIPGKHYFQQAFEAKKAQVETQIKTDLKREIEAIWAGQNGAGSGGGE